MACLAGSWLTESANWSISSTRMSTRRSSTAALKLGEGSYLQALLQQGKTKQQEEALPQAVSTGGPAQTTFDGVSQLAAALQHLCATASSAQDCRRNTHTAQHTVLAEGDEHACWQLDVTIGSVRAC